MFQKLTKSFYNKYKSRITEQKASKKKKKNLISEDEKAKYPM